LAIRALDQRIMAMNELIQRLIEDDNASEFTLILQTSFSHDLALNAVKSTQLAMKPLHLAASYGSANVAAALLNAGADPDVSDSQGRRPLHYAAANGRLGVMDLLLSHYADPNALTNVKCM
jgi:ankyrin repeat protein